MLSLFLHESLEDFFSKLYVEVEILLSDDEGVDTRVYECFEGTTFIEDIYRHIGVRKIIRIILVVIGVLENNYHFLEALYSLLCVGKLLSSFCRCEGVCEDARRVKFEIFDKADDVC